ncbi:type IV-A pilus assembly ATPase PilB [Sedimenticola selenatireducens]|uniref:Type IV-A pilus assembly ATPase PilB n=1 Tax=Sedimenticola selenatireducens TaxID=191960 RepID=A0A557S065_9GAMM|nr:type IV-A pilus assembly ATPase PilB [Sedimenticola selenatireducens]TVO70779.1 type IV-A pilus assembly ATPase PilB [Sedimenticola selenatireducens]TVT65699.1 MAG: type IV-A pilus assembly ATPase PilB [Sedimenticola selenatireducens]
MTTATQNIALSGLPRRLVADNLLSEESAQKSIIESAKKRQQFVSYLVESKLLDSKSIALSASQEFGVPLFELEALDTSTAPISLVDEKLIRIHHALPIFRRGNRLFLAVSDPTNIQGLDEIKFHTGLAIEAIVVEEDKLVRAIEASLEANDTSMSDLLDADLDNLDISSEDPDAHKKEGDLDVDDAPVVRFVNKMLLDAINTGASDIHFEPYEKTFRVRLRQDGILREVSSPPINIASRLTARIKVMSRMNIAERRVPQDGRIKMKLSRNRSIDFRVNTCPTLYGEKVVLRILDPTSAQLGIEALGFDPVQKEMFETALKKPYGMILVTGPTGSGKTVSLYTGLNMLNSEGVNISTAEDPVEIQVAGINQVNVNVKTGLTFASALRAFLRQDPDIVMVGEIRDLETAEIAVKAAQTGHLVLSTLHTNDAPQTLTRLANMGIPPFNIASSVILIMAQRLARRLCEHCKVVDELPKEALIEEGFNEGELDNLTIYKAVGCDRCTNGYKGRVGIFQIMPISSEMEKLVMEGGNSLQLEAQSKAEGILTLREAGLDKVRAGITSLEDINRVTKD